MRRKRPQYKRKATRKVAVNKCGFVRREDFESIVKRGWKMEYKELLQDAQSVRRRALACLDDSPTDKISQDAYWAATELAHLIHKLQEWGVKIQPHEEQPHKCKRCEELEKGF